MAGLGYTTSAKAAAGLSRGGHQPVRQYVSQGRDRWHATAQSFSPSRMPIMVSYGWRNWSGSIASLDLSFDEIDEVHGATFSAE